MGRDFGGSGSAPCNHKKPWLNFPLTFPQPHPPMPLKIKSSPSPPASPFTWDLLPHTPPSDLDRPPSPPTSWLTARDMKTFGAEPLVHDIGIVKCKDCLKPVLRSAVLDHVGMCSPFSPPSVRPSRSLDNCAKIRNGGKKGAKGKVAEAEGTSSPFVFAFAVWLT